jgi:hypothetical protein
VEYSLIIFLLIVAVSIYRGYRSGVAVIVARIFSLALAYAAAILLTERLGGWVQTITPLKGLLSYFAAGMILFIGASVVFSSLFSLVIRTAFPAKEGVSQGSAIAGALLGGTLGLIVGIIAVWFLSTFYGLLQLKANKPVNPPTGFEKAAQKITSGALKQIAEKGLSDSELSSGAISLLSDPGKNIKHYKQLASSGLVTQLFNSGQVRQALEDRNPARLHDTEEFKQLVNNPDFKVLASTLGLSNDEEQTNQKLAVKITKAFAQVQQLQTDPEYLSIIEDPFVRRNIESGNLFNLLNNEKIARLFSIMARTDVGGIEFDSSSLNTNQVPQIKPQVHRWVDENGKVHYSDKKKDN